MDEEGHLSNVFQTNERSIAVYEAFGDVESFDATYLMNKFDMLFSPFVRAIHYEQIILFGCGLLLKVDTKT